MDILEGDPFDLGHDAVAPTASAGAGEPPNASEPVAAGLVDAAFCFLDEMDLDELFFGLDLDAREAVAAEMFGHHSAPLLEDPEEEEAADEDGSDASDGLADAGEITPEAVEDDDKGGPPTPEPEPDEFVLPKGCSLRWYAHPDRPGQGFWQAKIPKGSEAWEGHRSKQLKFKIDDPVEEADTHNFCLDWLKRWTARASGSDGGASASGAGA